MLRILNVSNFGVLPDAKFEFSPGLNVVVGTNGSGKSQLLKLAYTCVRWSRESGLRGEGRPDKVTMQRELAGKLHRVFRPESLGNLVKRGKGVRRCEISAEFGDASVDLPHLNFAFSFSTKSKTDVVLESGPEEFAAHDSVFFPTNEVLSVFPGFAAAYRSRELAFDETYYDLSLALESSLVRGPRLDEVNLYLGEIENILKGKIKYKDGRFYLDQPGSGMYEMSLVAEGWRKIGSLAYLVANGTLLKQAVLFWDEAETNLNAEYLKLVARVLAMLGRSGLQVFVATHSLFLLRELSMSDHGKHSPAYISLGRQGLGPVEFSGGPTMSDLNFLALLDEEILQSERYLAHY